jgi:predicted N-formylglutamate amidohydrolase
MTTSLTTAVVRLPGLGAPILLTCEHASNDIPAPWRAKAEDAALLDDHWGWDIGAHDLTVALSEVLGAEAVLSRFSRLLCDPNRAWDDPSCVVETIDGRPVGLNLGLGDAERHLRRVTLYDPYHEAIDAALTARGAPALVVSIHSFTPSLRGEARWMEAGVLYDAHDALAETWAEAIAQAGVIVAKNAPYSGKAGLIYSAKRHGDRHGLPYLELEVRQDLIHTPERARAWAERLAPTLTPVLRQAGLWTPGR